MPSSSLSASPYPARTPGQDRRRPLRGRVRSRRSELLTFRGSTSTPGRGHCGGVPNEAHQHLRGAVGRSRSGYRGCGGWLDDGIAANGACGREFGKRQCAWVRCDVRRPKSVSLVRPFTDPVCREGAHRRARTGHRRRDGLPLRRSRGHRACLAVAAVCL